MFFFSTLVLVASLLSHATQAREARHFVLPKPVVSKTIPFKAASPIAVSSSVLSLSRTGGPNTRNAGLMKGRIYVPPGISTTLTSVANGASFSASITFGNETFEVYVDTGSSDTWLVKTGFQCVETVSGALLDESECRFGPTYNVTDSFTEIPGQHMNITYFDGAEWVTGALGYEHVTLAGISLNQTVGLIKRAAWDSGDGITSGLMGLAYPSMTSAYKGTNPELDKHGEEIAYSPIFTNMYEHGLVKPLFSLAIERGPDGPSGYLALGGIPPVAFVPPYTATPILVTKVHGHNHKDLTFYTIGIDGLALNGTTMPKSGHNYIVDSGTTVNFLPSPLAHAINAAFDPPAKFREDWDLFYVECDAVAPSLGVIIEGRTFWHDKLDLIRPLDAPDKENQTCISTIGAGGDDADDMFILGDAFLKNVLAVFDVGAGMLKFAPRVEHASVDPH